MDQVLKERGLMHKYVKTYRKNLAMWPRIWKTLVTRLGKEDGLRFAVGSCVCGNGLWFGLGFRLLARVRICLFLIRDKCLDSTQRRESALRRVTWRGMAWYDVYSDEWCGCYGVKITWWVQVFASLSTLYNIIDSTVYGNIFFPMFYFV